MKYHHVLDIWYLSCYNIFEKIFRKEHTEMETPSSPAYHTWYLKAFIKGGNVRCLYKGEDTNEAKRVRDNAQKTGTNIAELQCFYRGRLVQTLVSKQGGK